MQLMNPDLPGMSFSEAIQGRLSGAPRAMTTSPQKRPWTNLQLKHPATRLTVLTRSIHSQEALNEVPKEAED